ncbi:MAG: Polyketide synthase PksL [Luteibacter sp.]|uniref:SDR family NAD(P)-dependent oxidoreductase n=1 Tax=Luteibacter sp. TaxID=1886636 RepID=UPI0013860F16|nr:SDR family NAD(P)-dependent oxidoreductase [Luteibacter sp.]KAF1007424.1 MAG: Polyketide synthase PksL [Luteibacter sp.]
MVSFVEFVVSEWKGRRLSKTDAAELIRQFSERRQGGRPLHPLLHENVSDLSRQAFRSAWRGNEPFLADHRVLFADRPLPVLPAAAYLEAIHAAIERATPREEQGGFIEIRHAAWIAPLIVDGAGSLLVTVSPGDDGNLDIDMLSGEGDDVQVHCQASAAWFGGERPAAISIDELRGEMQAAIDPVAMYDRFVTMGLHYGSSHRTVVSLRKGAKGALARLIRQDDSGQSDGMSMPPGVLDGALQATIALTVDQGEPHLPFAVEQVRVFAAVPKEAWAWVRPGRSTDGDIRHINVDLLDDDGCYLVSLRGLSSRPLVAEDEVARILRPTSPQASPCPWREHATYLIVHGLDEPGESIVQAILRRTRHTRVVLAGLQPAENRRVVEALEANGERLAYLRIEGVGEHMPVFIADEAYPLRGVLHVVSDRSHGGFEDLSVIDAGTKDHKLDFFATIRTTDSVDDMAAFASRRHADMSKGHRHGTTFSFDWRQGMLPGAMIDALDAALVGGLSRAVLGVPHGASPSSEDLRDAAADEDMLTRLRDFLRREFAAVLKLRADRIDTRASLDDYGVDSIVAMKLTRRIEASFGPQSKTLLFEYRDLVALATHLAQAHPDVVAAMFKSDDRAIVSKAAMPSSPAPRRRSSRLSRAVAVSTATMQAEPIAIVGLSGRYPQSPDLATFWNNLRDGVDCVVEVPADRWDWRDYYSEDRTADGRHFSRWGGFIAGVDEFDPLFFRMSPKEAERIDPQERLFLQHAWMAMEDAGYTRAALGAGGDVGVYVGMMYSEYQLFAAESSVRGRRMGVAGSFASTANRVSFALDLHGPSMTVDTMCSSSLTAIHLACQDLRSGRTHTAIAGGVNVTIHPNKYLALSSGQFISSEGHCQSFGEGGDGYIPGEGVGAVVLKRLSDAERDGDVIHGVIRGSALNHGGRTNGYTVPNPQAQAAAIDRALAEAGVDARRVSYVEAHGTGTKLGDPIEIAALSRAFGAHTSERGFCLLGSAKSNIGHCEAAAGIAGLTKVLLQMRHRQVVPSLHSSRLNPHIDFDAGPFTVNQTLRAWESPVVDGRRGPRVAGLSSFGAGGSNAHMVVEDYEASAVQLPEGPVVVVLSGRTEAALRGRAEDLLGYLSGDAGALASVAYTLQVGREAMNERLAVVASNAEELVSALRGYLAGEDREGLYVGQAQEHRESVAWFAEDAELREAVSRWATTGRLERVAQAWVRGVEIPWTALHGGRVLPKVGLPTYPFARERYWLSLPTAETPASGVSRLHPLLHENVSDLGRQAFRSSFRGDEPFLRGHRLQRDGISRPLMPAAAWLGMAHAALERAMPAQALKNASLVTLHDIAWPEPLFVDSDVDVDVELRLDERGDVSIDMASVDAGVVRSHAHMRGRLAAGSLDFTDLAAIEAGADAGRFDTTEFYARFDALGLIYGPEHKTVRGIAKGRGELLARLQSTTTVPAQAIPPDLVDGALQACIALLDDTADAWLPFAVKRVVVAAPCSAEMFAWVRCAADDDDKDGSRRFDIDIVDRQGRTCVRMESLGVRRMPADAPAAGRVAFVAGWEPVSGHEVVSTDPTHWCIVGATSTQRAQMSSTWATASTTWLDAPMVGTEEAFLADVLREIQSLADDGGSTALRMACLGGVDDACMSALGALLATAAIEHPELSPALVDARVDRAAVDRLPSFAVSGAFVRLDASGGGERRTWIEHTVTTERRVTIRRDGVYLVTGGLGGIGRIIVRELLSAGARVVVTGRAARPVSFDEALAGWGEGVSYRQLDLADGEAVRAAVSAILTAHGRLDGVLHLAGEHRDAPLIGKSRDAFVDLLRPKVTGTRHLDDATRDIQLDAFVLFSSVAGAFGNLGQADYASANGYMDGFAVQRARRVAAGERHGRTVSIGWPLWAEGGMQPEAKHLEHLARTIGMRPLATAQALDAFHAALADDVPHLAILGGDTVRLRRAVAGVKPTSAVAAGGEVAIVPSVPGSSSLEVAEAFLRERLAATLSMPAAAIDAAAPFEDYGLDSILAVRLAAELEKSFGPLSKTLFYEHRTLRGLAAFLLEAKPQAWPSTPEKGGEAPAVAVAAAQPFQARSFFQEHRLPIPARERDVAIVGLAGRYPMAADLEGFWTNLREGRDCIGEVPADRWDHARYFDPTPGKAGATYSKWGGFLDDIDRFDPLFFGIAPKEAALLDPQERLFMETSWQAVEDAGYPRAALSGSRTGVFVGVMWGHYELYGAQALSAGQGVPSSSYASIANRVSWLFDLRGPSMAIDTMCSSSLTAIHLAAEEIRRGNIDAAIAGGVNASVHPHKYLTLSQGRFAATDGRCRSFGAGGDGYVPGEGVDAVYMKPLEDAVRDGDHVYGIVRSSALNHGGRTSGYTVPNPVAQAELIEAAFARAGIPAESVSYIEAHGTGTALGDPIEIAGLAKAFSARGVSTQGCAIGSVKSNIGHLESAAGIAAVTKVLLQMRHGELVPSLHAEVPNPNIAFADTPFRVQRHLEPWRSAPTAPRRAGVSSFGAGGANAHVVLEEWRDTAAVSTVEGSVALVLSARDPIALAQLARKIAAHLDHAGDEALGDIAFTLQAGRTPMDVRLGMVVATVREAVDRLRHWADMQIASPAALLSQIDDGTTVGHASQMPIYAQRLVDGEAGRNFVAQLVARHDLGRLVHLWVMGISLDWTPLHAGCRRRRVSLPTYPFQRQRCWVGPQEASDGASPTMASSGRLLRRWEATPSRPGHGVRGDVLVGGAILESSSHAWAGECRVVGVSRATPDIETCRGLIGGLVAAGTLPERLLWRASDDRNDALSLFLLLRALLEAGQAMRLAVVIDEGHPVQEALIGLLHSLSLEQPAWRVLAIVVDDVHGAMPDELACLALDEMAAAIPGAAEIRFTRGEVGGTWARYERILSVVPGIGQASMPVPLRHGGTYLVTGGLGGLGRIIAGDLMRRYQARIVLVGRSALDDEGRRALDRLATEGGAVEYVSVDVADASALETLVGTIRSSFGELHGVLHAAGVRRDGAMLQKDADTFRDVARAKVDGTVSLDEATRDCGLDIFVLFSSIAGVNGNPGQADYAYGNRFLDGFAEHRERLRLSGCRRGRTFSIAWPLWEEGGMQLDAEQATRLRRRTGVVPMPAAEGLRHFHAALRGAETVVVPLYGDLERLRSGTAMPGPVSAPQDVPIADNLLDLVRGLVGEEIGVPASSIAALDRFDALGLDSIAIGRLTARLRDIVDDAPQTLFYEHETVGSLVGYLSGRARLPSMRAVAAERVTDRTVPPMDDTQGKVAIVGIHGRFPGGTDLDAFWETLAEGREAIGPVPASRWDADAWHDDAPDAAARGRIHCRHGGFVDDIDHFDADFFRIAHDEAAVMDPQERIFVQSVWHALEDAGYSRQSLRRKHPRDRGANVGVFVGTTTQSYALLADAARRDGVMQAPSSLPWSIANRTSYLFDFRGPSMPVDTACSSALVGLHLACESLRRGDCAVAVAGAVNLYLHPLKYLSLCQRGMLARHGATRSFGEGDEGFVPGEGVATLILKRLDDAIADGDRIHGVVAATGFEHAGRGNGYSAPNPNAQAALIRRVLQAGNIHPDTIDCVEGHGTGTPLGDDIELRALDQVFAGTAGRSAPASLGCVKSNIGHLEAAAGMSSMAKVLLQMRHGRFVPTLHARDAIPSDALVLQHAGGPWWAPADRPRRALVNAFGAGGVNACVVLESAPVVHRAAEAPAPDGHAFLLSAADAMRLRAYATSFVEWLPATTSPLSAVCDALRRREPMAARLAVFGRSTDDIVRQLREWLADRPSGVHVVIREAGRTPAAPAWEGGAEPWRESVVTWPTGKAPDETGRNEAPPPGMPVYPFAPTRHWISTSTPHPEAHVAARNDERLHPWVSYNASTLRQTAFDSWLRLDGGDGLTCSHEGQARLAPAALMEIAVACGTLAGEHRVGMMKEIRFTDRLTFERDLHLVRTVLAADDDGIRFTITTGPGETSQCLAEGRLVPGDARSTSAGPRRDLQRLRKRAHDVSLPALVAHLRAHGRTSSIEGIEALWMCGAHALARLALPDNDASSERFVMRPAIFSALSDVLLAWLDRDDPSVDYEIGSIAELCLHRGLPNRCNVLVERGSGNGQGTTLDAILLDDHGETIAVIRGIELNISRPTPARGAATRHHHRQEEETQDVRNRGLA